jgi:hypothetical protein
VYFGEGGLQPEKQESVILSSPNLDHQQKGNTVTPPLALALNCTISIQDCHTFLKALAIVWLHTLICKISVGTSKGKGYENVIMLCASIWQLFGGK